MKPAPALIATRPIVRLDERGQPHAASVTIAEETPVTLVYNGRRHAVMMATPSDLEDFAIGFSLTEGIVQAADALRAISIQSEQDGSVTLDIRIGGADFARLLEMGRRSMAGRSGCGVCGAERIEDVLRPLPTVPRGTPVALSAIRRALVALDDAQVLNAEVRMVHGAAWADMSGAIQCVREDIGRHNALDKLIGARCKAAIPETGFAMITSRCSFEMVQKAVAAGMTMLVALSAPTARAVRLADEAGLTVIARARAAQQSIFTHPWRVDHTA